VYTGLVGARFERAEHMESKHLLVTRTQNVAEKGYGPRRDISGTEGEATTADRDPLLDVWAEFYNLPHFPLFVDVPAESPDFLRINNDTFLNVKAYVVTGLSPLFLPLSLISDEQHPSM
jgi:hypothetical protein